MNYFIAKKKERKINKYNFCIIQSHAVGSVFVRVESVPLRMQPQQTIQNSKNEKKFYVLRIK